MSKSSLFSLLLVLGFSTFGFAQSQYGAVSTATGHTGVAAVEPTESPVLNPAAIPYARGYYFTSDYSNLYQGQEFTVGLADNLPDTIVPTALIYTQSTQTDVASMQPFTTQDFHLEFANMVTPKFSFGMSVRYKTDTVFLTQYRQQNLLLGSIWTPAPDLGIGLTVDNIFSPDTSVPMDYRLNPGMVLGVNYHIKRSIRLKFDIQTASNNSMDLPTLAAGIETHWNRWLIMRIGDRKTMQTGTDEYGAGVGFTGPKFALQYGYTSCPQDDRLTRQAVDFAVPIW
jgi:hypothetical protein